MALFAFVSFMITLSLYFSFWSESHCFCLNYKTFETFLVILPALMLLELNKIMLSCIPLVVNFLFLHLKTVDRQLNLEKYLSAIKLLVDKPSSSRLLRVERTVAHGTLSSLNPYLRPHCNLSAVAVSVHISPKILLPVSNGSVTSTLLMLRTKFCNVSTFWSSKSWCNLGSIWTRSLWEHFST